MTFNVVSAAYIVSAVLFVLSLAGLSKHESAKEGNRFGIAAMVIALGATKHEHQPGTSFRVFLDPAGHPFCLCAA